MLIDGVQLAPGSTFANATIDSGTAFPANADAGELFFRPDLDNTLHYYNGTEWLEIATGALGEEGATGTGAIVYNNAPSFIGFPTSTTPSVNDSSTVIATTAFVKAVVAAIPAPVVPYDIAGSIMSKPTASAVVTRFVATRGFTIPNAYTGSSARTATAATGSYVLSIARNGTLIGTITFAAAATTGTFAGTGATFAAGDVLTVTAPGTADATFNDATFTIAATLA